MTFTVEPYSIPIQLCTVTGITGKPACRRIARWKWQPDGEDHPVFLCNYHFQPFAATEKST